MIFTEKLPFYKNINLRLTDSQILAGPAASFCGVLTSANSLPPPQKKSEKLMKLTLLGVEGKYTFCNVGNLF